MVLAKMLCIFMHKLYIYTYVRITCTTQHYIRIIEAASVV